MIKKLRQIYSSLVIYQKDIDHLDSGYKWFITTANEIIGIKPDELTTKDKTLLNVFLSPYNVTFPLLTEKEQKWRNLIDNTKTEEIPNIKNSYRFVYFTIQKNQIDPKLFKDAIHELFAKQVPILWENSHEGIIIEEQKNVSESISYEQIIDILMSDLYVKLNFFVGPFQKEITDVNHHYQFLVKSGKIAFSFSKQTVVTYIDAVPFLFINQLDLDLRSDIAQTVLQEFINDEETLKMIETFVQCNLNISETAKELYMHRNSLQYRLDRFLERTGVDIRQFHHAMTVYLALLAKE